jgi:Family of unknown function (DUF5681)
MPFVKGQSGNPDGRPLGARNSKTLAAEALLQARAEEVVNFAVEKALAGNPGALRACMDRLLPPRRDRPVPFVLPPTVSAADTERAVADIGAGVGTGEITPREALMLLQIVEKSVRIVAAARLAQQRIDRETATAGAVDPAASEPHCNQQPAKETMKYNEPPRSANGAAEIGSHGGEQRTERTMKYNETPGTTNGGAETGSHGEEQRMEETTKYNEPLEPTGNTTIPIVRPDSVESLSTSRPQPGNSPPRTGPIDGAQASRPPARLLAA